MADFFFEIFTLIFCKWNSEQKNSLHLQRKQETMQLATLFLYIPGISLNVFIFKIEICRIRGIFISAQSSLALFFAKAVFFKSIKKNLLYRSIQQRKRGGKRGKKNQFRIFDYSNSQDGSNIWVLDFWTWAKLPDDFTALSYQP